MEINYQGKVRWCYSSHDHPVLTFKIQENTRRFHALVGPCTNVYRDYNSVLWALICNCFYPQRTHNNVFKYFNFKLLLSLDSKLFLASLFHVNTGRSCNQTFSLNEIRMSLSIQILHCSAAGHQRSFTDKLRFFFLPLVTRLKIPLKNRKRALNSDSVPNLIMDKVRKVQSNKTKYCSRGNPL